MGAVAKLSEVDARLCSGASAKKQSFAQNKWLINRQKGQVL